MSYVPYQRDKLESPLPFKYFTILTAHLRAQGSLQQTLSLTDSLCIYLSQGIVGHWAAAKLAQTVLHQPDFL